MGAIFACRPWFSAPFRSKSQVMAQVYNLTIVKRSVLDFEQFYQTPKLFEIPNP